MSPAVPGSGAPELAERSGRRGTGRRPSGSARALSVRATAKTRVGSSRSGTHVARDPRTRSRPSLDRLRLRIAEIEHGAPAMGRRRPGAQVPDPMSRHRGMLHHTTACPSRRGSLAAA